METNLRDSFHKKLKALRTNINPDDRIEAMKVLGISKPTLIKYLQGRGTKIDIALSLIQFLSGRVQERMDELKKTNVA